MHKKLYLKLESVEVIKVDDRRDLENRTLDAKIDTVNKMLK